MKILVLDIETSYNVAGVWGLFNQNVSLPQLQEVSRVLCFGAKWHGSKGTLFYSDYFDGHDVMIQRAYELLDEADVVVHYNGTSFDIPHLMREFLLAGMTPPSSFQEIDLLRVIRKRFKFASNKLDHVSQQLGLAGKAGHTGYQLWVDCLAGDPKAWKLMKKYNVQDVVLTDELYLLIRPWIPNHPSHGLYNGSEEDTCTNCGGDDLERRGFKYTNLGKYQQYRCRECGAWSRSGKSEQLTDLRGSA